jgi:hypothetical protein
MQLESIDVAPSRLRLPDASASVKRPIYFLFHVPKCAGRTIDRHLAIYSPRNSYFCPKKRRGIARFFAPRHNLSGMPEPAELRAIGGHMLGCSLERSFEGREIRRTILLRDPVSHMVSYYNFRMERYIAQGLQPYSFDLAYRATQRNFLTHFILRNFLEIRWPKILLLREEQKWALVNRFLSSFWFVGDYGRCGELIAAVAPDLGVPDRAVPQNICSGRSNHPNWRPLSHDDLPDSMVRRIRDENPLDQLLWQTWQLAGHDVAGVQVAALEERSSRFGFTANESLRVFFQAGRRAARRWPAVDGSAAAVWR